MNQPRSYPLNVLLVCAVIGTGLIGTLSFISYIATMVTS